MLLLTEQRGQQHTAVAEFDELVLQQRSVGELPQILDDHNLPRKEHPIVNATGKLWIGEPLDLIGQQVIPNTVLVVDRPLGGIIHGGKP